MSRGKSEVPTRNRRPKAPYIVRPPTAVLTRGFDPSLSVGSARPAVFRSSKYVFSSPENAERAFNITLGKAHAEEGERVDLAMFSFDVVGGKAGAFDFLRRLTIARNAVSLGGVESLACHPATTTHSEIPHADLEAAGIGDSLVRISTGVEDWRDLLHDFRQALDGIRA